MTACNLERSFARIVEFCFENTSNAVGISHDIACAAGGEYAWQTMVTVDDLIVSDPAKWVSRIDSFSMEKRARLFDIFSMASCTFLAGTIGEISRTRVYAFSSILFGICKYNTPDSSEFSIASFCRQLTVSVNECGLSSALIEQFGKDLFEFADRSPEYWDPSWVKLSFALLSMAHSNLAIRSGIVWDYIISKIDFSEIERSIDHFDVSSRESESVQEMIHILMDKI